MKVSIEGWDSTVIEYLILLVIIISSIAAYILLFNSRMSASIFEAIQESDNVLYNSMTFFAAIINIRLPINNNYEFQ